MVTKFTYKGVELSQSSPENSWRLVHDNEKVISFFESSGVTETKFTLFTGTKEECENQISALGLIPLEEIQEQVEE